MTARSSRILLVGALACLLSGPSLATEPAGKGQQGGSAPRDQPAAPLCGDKRTCKDMSSCAEARYYLENCGLLRLDRDGDGIPCESLCKSKR